jgi:hypothetical protein
MLYYTEAVHGNEQLLLNGKQRDNFQLMYIHQMN